MAGNGAIQFLRGSYTKIEEHVDDILLAGQPLYDTTNNALYIGDGSTTLGNLSAIGGNTTHLYRHIITITASNISSVVIALPKFIVYSANSKAYTINEGGNDLFYDLGSSNGTYFFPYSGIVSLATSDDESLAYVYCVYFGYHEQRVYRYAPDISNNGYSSITKISDSVTQIF